jgi:hypothetical protein
VGSSHDKVCYILLVNVVRRGLVSDTQINTIRRVVASLCSDLVLLLASHTVQLRTVFCVVLRCSALCNDSSLSYQSDAGSYTRIGESTELALRVFVEKVGLNVSSHVKFVNLVIAPICSHATSAGIWCRL